MSKRDQHNTIRYPASRLGLLLVTSLLLATSLPQAAEIRGAVFLQQTGLFGGPQENMDKLPISVALFPAEGQALPHAVPEAQAVTLTGNRITPLYLAIRRGSRLDFHNQDHLYHELFSQSDRRGKPLELRMSRDTPAGRAQLHMHELAEWHWFCRIHARSYARVDVLDTPLIRMVKPGEGFEFRDLPRGNWRVRIAAPGAETKFIETEALTAPPPLNIQLTVKGFTRTAGFNTPQVVAVEQLFPGQPGN